MEAEGEGWLQGAPVAPASSLSFLSSDSRLPGLREGGQWAQGPCKEVEKTRL